MSGSRKDIQNSLQEAKNQETLQRLMAERDGQNGTASTSGRSGGGSDMVAYKSPSAVPFIGNHVIMVGWKPSLWRFQHQLPLRIHHTHSFINQLHTLPLFPIRKIFHIGNYDRNYFLLAALLIKSAMHKVPKFLLCLVNQSVPIPGGPAK